MKQDFFTYLPPEITINILSRLPVRTTMSCKCVCKPWLNLLTTTEFVKSHISISSPGLAVSQGETSSRPYRVFEYVDERYCSVVFNFSFPCHELIHSSANGLLFLYDHKIRPHNLFICNPVTFDYIKLPCPQISYICEFMKRAHPQNSFLSNSIKRSSPQIPSSSKRQPHIDTFGFGVSNMTGQYKVVRIFHERLHNQESSKWRVHNQPECQVYTLGTGSWRSIAPSGLLKYESNSVGALLNGNFHWLVSDLEDFLCVSCFDLETEVFSTFSPPHIHGHHSSRTLTALGECLCLCDNSSDVEIVIWLMHEYGDDKSWTKQCIITKMSPDELYGLLCPIKIFEDGDILIAKEGRSRLLCYSNKTETIEETDVIELNEYDCTSAVSYTPSLLSLKTFTNENVRSFRF